MSRRKSTSSITIALKRDAWRVCQNYYEDFYTALAAGYELPRPGELFKLLRDHHNRVLGARMNGRVID